MLVSMDAAIVSTAGVLVNATFVIVGKKSLILVCLLATNTKQASVEQVTEAQAGVLLNKTSVIVGKKLLTPVYLLACN